LARRPSSAPGSPLVPGSLPPLLARSRHAHATPKDLPVLTAAETMELKGAVAPQRGDEPDAPTEGEELAATLVADLDVAPRVPLATYRLQLNAGFTFRDARRIVPYLAELGISDLYASPYLKARPGSSHGYDVDDYGRLNPEVGREADYDALVDALARQGMGQIEDFVPNHMGIGRGTNAWWTDLLENGRCSPYGAFFDVDWDPVKPDLRGRVLLPFLGDQYGVVLERGEIRLGFDPEAGTFSLAYYENRLPVAPPTYPLVLRHGLDRLIATVPPDDLDLLDFQSIITALERLPGQDETDPELIAERQREQVVAKHRLAEVVRRSEPIRAAVTAAIDAFNGDPADPRSFDALDALLEAQTYRLSYWKVAAEEINYRRFFAINELAAVRQEEPAVFAASHALVLGLLAEGRVTGLRIDHVDGLLDPAGYVRQLQRAYLLEVCRRQLAELGQQSAAEAGTGVPAGDHNDRVTPDGNVVAVDGGGGLDWEALRPLVEARLDRAIAEDPAALGRPLYLLVEKILEHGEDLPSNWAVHGTTGYEFANAATGLFVDAANRRAFDDLYARFVGEKVDFAAMVYACKRLIMRVALASEVAVLASALDRIAEQNRRSRDYTLNNLRDALREVIACFPVYRTYVVCDGSGVEARDRRTVEAAIATAKRRTATVDVSVFDFVRDVLLMRTEAATDEQRAEQCRFAMKFQQLTGPVMAKGLEDTAFYRYNRLTALNEVGGDPTLFGTSVAAFHRQNAERLRRWPDAMLCSSTHDTKRSEDVRARIAVLSELPREWRVALNRWARLNRKHKVKVDGAAAPDRNDEYLFYQTVLGAWPFDHELADDREAWEGFVGRIEDYLLKAVREAQVRTSWINPTDYEAAVGGFVRRVLGPGAASPFVEDAQTLRRKVAYHGALNGLGQQLVKLTSPGVPDVYQGTEVWDLSLVDPDNRRPVDYAHRTQLLRELRRRRDPEKLAGELAGAMDDGRIKLHVTHRTLAFRGAVPELFRRGAYLPVEAEGPRRDHVCAFVRRLDGSGEGEAGTTAEALVVVPRLTQGLTQGEEVPPTGEAVWGGTTLVVPGIVPGQTYRNLFTGAVVEAVDGGHGDRAAELPLGQVLATFPVALLERIGEGEAG
jgi:(1->4)-alpha-D-glucan 1-alpha-D-glucosylmutase